jgi:hypothetical protein
LQRKRRQRTVPNIRAVNFHIDQGGGLGLTDPVSGEVVVKLPASKPKAKKARIKKTTKRKKRH